MVSGFSIKPQKIFRILRGPRLTYHDWKQRNSPVSTANWNNPYS